MEDVYQHTACQPLLDPEAQDLLASCSPSQRNCDSLLFSFQKVDILRGAEEGKLLNYCWTEVKKQSLVAGPMIYIYLLQLSLRITPVMFVGHLGELALASASIASSFAEATGICILIGMASTLETLCGQAYGSKEYHLLGLFLVRAIVILHLTSIPIAIIWSYMGQILLAFGQDPAISVKAGEYARWLIPTLFAFASCQPLLRFLQAQSIMMPMVLCTSLTVCLHVPILWLLIYKSGLGSQGAAVATSLSNWIYVILLLIFIRFSKKCEKAQYPFSWKAFHDLRGFFKLAIPSVVMYCFEYWSFGVLTLLSGLLANPLLETSTTSISLSTTSMAYMIPFGLSAAASTRVSNELGAGYPLAARASVCVSVGLASLESVITATVFYLFRGQWGKVFSNDPEVINNVATVMPLLAITIVLDGVQCVLSGVARGCGRQAIGACVNLGAYYAVGLPAATVLAFIFHLQGKGLWMGILCGLFVQTLLLLAMTVFTNWDEQVKDANNRISSSLARLLPSDTGVQKGEATSVPFS